MSYTTNYGPQDNKFLAQCKTSDFSIWTARMYNLSTSKASSHLLLLYSQVCFGPGPEVIKLFLFSAQLSMKFILLINVKMPTIVKCQQLLAF